MCGGVLEIGAICAVVGFVAKKFHKCNCKCHDEHKDECCHCKEFDVNSTPSIKIINTTDTIAFIKNDKKRKNFRYKIVQYILGGIAAIGVALIGYSIISTHIHCEHEHCSHNHIEMKK